MFVNEPRGSDSHSGLSETLPAARVLGALFAYYCRFCPGGSPVAGPSQIIWMLLGMEGTCRCLCSLATVCCLLVGAFLPLPGDGQNFSSAVHSTVSHFTIPHNEISNLSLGITASTLTSVDSNTTVASQLNASSSSPVEALVPTTLASVNTIAGPRHLENGTNSTADILHSAPTANSMEANQSSLNETTSINITAWVISSTNFVATESSQLKGTRVPTTTPQPKYSTSNTLRSTERTPETIPVTNHETVTKESTAESTSTPSATLDASSTSRLTPEAVSSTLASHRETPMETEQPANHEQDKASVSNVRNDGEGLTSVPAYNSAGEDPLVIAVIFTFVVTVGILALMGFLRYRQRSSRLQFRRLQDLPMDDMMEDTPLSLYSY